MTSTLRNALMLLAVYAPLASAQSSEQPAQITPLSDNGAQLRVTGARAKEIFDFLSDVPEQDGVKATAHLKCLKPAEGAQEDAYRCLFRVHTNGVITPGDWDGVYEGTVQGPLGLMEYRTPVPRVKDTLLVKIEPPLGDMLWQALKDVKVVEESYGGLVQPFAAKNSAQIDCKTYANTMPSPVQPHPTGIPTHPCDFLVDKKGEVSSLSTMPRPPVNPNPKPPAGAKTYRVTYMGSVPGCAEEVQMAVGPDANLRNAPVGHISSISIEDFEALPEAIDELAKSFCVFEVKDLATGQIVYKKKS